MIRSFLRSVWGAVFGAARPEPVYDPLDPSDPDDPVSDLPPIRLYPPDDEELMWALRSLVRPAKPSKPKESETSFGVDLDLFDRLAENSDRAVAERERLANSFGLRNVEEPAIGSETRPTVGLSFYPHPLMDQPYVILRDGDVLVDAGDQPVARVRLGSFDAKRFPGTLRVSLGTSTRVEIEWLTDNPFARRIARVKDAPWVGASPSADAMRCVGVREAVEALIEVDENAGKLPARYASFLRRKLKTAVDYEDFYRHEILGAAEQV